MMKRIVCALLAAGALCAPAAEVKVDFGKAVGPVKPVNGVGQPPLVGKLANYPMFHYLKEAGIPYSRLHDVGGWRTSTPTRTTRRATASSTRTPS